MEFNDQQDREEIYSKPVRAGKRTYFFDVKHERRRSLFNDHRKQKTVSGGRNFLLRKT